MVVSVVVGDAVAGNDVPEADGAECDKAKVTAVQKSPPLPLAEEDRAATDVGDLISILQILVRSKKLHRLLTNLVCETIKLFKQRVVHCLSQIWKN